MPEAQERQAQTVVTSETLQEFQLNRLGVSETTEDEVKPAEQQAEEVPQEEVIPPDGTMREGEVVFRGKWVKKNDYSYRMHLKTEEVKKERQARESAEAKLRELEAKYTPKKEEENEKPDPAKFTDLDEYSVALEKWSRQQAIIERDKAEEERKNKEVQDKFLASWKERESEARKIHEDFDDLVQNSDVAVSNEVAQALYESDIGPQILYHLVSNPDVADKIKNMTVTGALREIGKIEAKLEKGTEKKPEEQKQQVKPKPAPIAPVRTNSQASSVDGLFDSDGNFKGNAAQYRQLRKEGRIK